MGETYNIGGNSERRNIDVVTAICDILDELRPDAKIGSRRKFITYVKDRPGPRPPLRYRRQQNIKRAQLDSRAAI